jgi:hypothetical protein
MQKIIEIARALQQQNFSNAELGPRTVWLLLQRIIDEAEAEVMGPTS